MIKIIKIKGAIWEPHEWIGTAKRVRNQQFTSTSTAAVIESYCTTYCQLSWLLLTPFIGNGLRKRENVIRKIKQ